MARVSLSDIDRSIESIWSWYEDQKEALRDFRYKIIGSMGSPTVMIKDKFITLSINELNDYFDKSEEELEQLVCFNLISAAEGLLRKDFFNKVYQKDRSQIGRDFRSIFKEKEHFVSLENDIITSWKDNYPTNKSNFSDYLGLLHYRHWLAHGRYWNLSKHGRQYSALETYSIAESIFDIVG